MFHPEGMTFVGRTVAVDGPYRELGEELAGRVLVRASAALWRGDFEHLDVLGMALRFRRSAAEFDARARPGDQDLLTATIRSPLTMLASPFFTDATDFVGNKYWAVSPFETDVGRVELRLVPVDPARFPGRRAARLFQAVQAGRASWWVEARRTLRLRWHRVARVDLEHEVDIDQDALFFDPFRGTLRPVGLVHAIRHATYAASQRTRAIISGEHIT
jgi:hypothetical protein